METVDPTIIFATLDAQGRKQQWLANTTGVSVSYVTKMKRRDRPTPRAWALKAATALGIPHTLFLAESSRGRDNTSRISAAKAAD